jgi:hypothetical protein
MKCKAGHFRFPSQAQGGGVSESGGGFPQTLKTGFPGGVNGGLTPAGPFRRYKSGAVSLRKLLVNFIKL